MHPCTRRQLRASAVLVFTSFVTVPEAHATSALGDIKDSLDAAEAAYAQVDLTTTHQIACEALERGGAAPPQTLRLHLLCGISAAALDKSEEARAEFVVALALRPNLRLERELSPKIRSPYLEAQGYWSRFEDRLLLEPAPIKSPAKVQFAVLDPAHLADTLRIYLRTKGETTFQAYDMKLDSLGAVPLTARQIAGGCEYYVLVLDRHGNGLVELGSEASPLEVTSARSEPPPKVHEQSDALRVSKHERPSQWLPIALTATGVVAGAIGGYFNVLREKDAHKWNGPSCEQPGLTRLEQCSSVNSDRVSAERAAIGFYLAGGVLLASGITLFALPASSHEARPESATISCGLLTTGLTCKGAF